MQTTSSCNGYPVLKAPVIANAAYQWYKDSIAIKGATDSLYYVPDTIGKSYYNVLISTNTQCIISEPFLVMASKLNEINIPADTVLCSHNTLLLAPAFEGITYYINGTASSVVSINKEGHYTIIANDIYGCQKTFNTNVVAQNCSDCDAHIPTGFTPNGDGVNDIFKPILHCNLSAFDFIIFNRWGQKIFESRDINKGWDGTYSGSKMPAGAYVYFLAYKTSSNITKAIKGMIVLVK
jgi:gliding motility-associated-like protein